MEISVFFTGLFPFKSFRKGFIINTNPPIFFPLFSETVKDVRSTAYLTILIDFIFIFIFISDLDGNIHKEH